MIVLLHLPSKCAHILYNFSLTKMYHQRRRVVYQNPFAGFVVYFVNDIIAVSEATLVFQIQRLVATGQLKLPKSDKDDFKLLLHFISQT